MLLGVLEAAYMCGVNLSNNFFKGRNYNNNDYPILECYKWSQMKILRPVIHHHCHDI